MTKANKIELDGEVVRIILSNCQVIEINKITLQRLICDKVYKTEDCNCGDSGWRPYNER